MQGFSSGIPSDIQHIVTVVDECISDVSSWCASKRLQLNTTKTEILWSGSTANLRMVSPGSKVISVGRNVIELARSLLTLVC